MDSSSTRQQRSRARLVPAAGLVALLLGGCGGGGVTLPTPSGSLSVPSISVSIPSITRSPSAEAPQTPTAEPSTEAPTEAPTETPTKTPTKTETPTPTPTKTKPPTKTPTETTSVVVTATVTPTKEVTRTATATPTPTPTPSITASAAGEPVDAEGGGIPGWVWLVLAAVLAGLAWFLWARNRRATAWDAEVAETETEVAWFGRELLPQLQRSTTPEALAGGWQVSAARVSAVEDRLTGLEASAPDEQRAARARTLRDAVRASRTDVETLVATRDQAATPVQLAAASSRLLDAVNPPPPPAR
ncbi:MAG TPA: hypothetical protein VFL10_02405 [Ornithinibacter sp.]|nr:hypothetical protein [Ornithinibacter sp.]